MPSVKFVNCLFLLNSEDDDDHDGYSKPELLLGIYNSLRQICNLDMVGLLVRPVVVMSLSSSSPPQWVCTVVAELITSLTSGPEFASFNGLFPSGVFSRQARSESLRCWYNSY